MISFSITEYIDIMKGIKMDQKYNDRQLNVLHVISGGDTGGAKTSVITLLRELKDLSDIKLVCFIESDFTKEAFDNGIETVVFKQKSRFDMSVLIRLKKYIVDEKFDIVNCHGARANFIISLIKKRLNIPVITTIHSDYLHDFDNNIYKKFIFTMLNKKSLRVFDGYIAMAKKFQEDMTSRGFKNVYVAYNGISTSTFNNDLSSEEFLVKYNVPYNDKYFYIGSATRLHPVKGVDVLLRAAKIVIKQSSDIIFLIAGYGDEKYEKEYKEYIRSNNLEKNVYLLGFINNIDDFYNSINLNAITSHSEAVCYALLEGARYSLPSIGSKVGGIPELLTHNETGLLFSDNDCEELASLILKLYKDKDLADKIGKNLNKLVIDEFSDIAMAKRYLDLYVEILKKRKS
jgi:L-malate glycosyltransferase